MTRLIKCECPKCAMDYMQMQALRLLDADLRKFIAVLKAELKKRQDVHDKVRSEVASGGWD